MVAAAMTPNKGNETCGAVNRVDDECQVSGRDPCQKLWISLGSLLAYK
jgi:hypothetical protein